MYRHAIVLLLAAATPVAAQGERHALAGSQVAIYDLAGDVRLEPGSGTDVTVEVTRTGRDAAKLDVQQGDLAGRQALRIVYPADRIHYEAMGRGSRTRLHVRDDGTFGDDVHGGRTVEISAEDDGLDAAANLRVTVPQGKTVIVHLAVGSASATNVNGDLHFDVHAASVTTRDTRGRLSIDGASGEVHVTGADGDTDIDTGSGTVDAQRVRGSLLHVDTGSGNVSVSDLNVSRLDLDVGSGNITATTARAPDMRFDSGSGDVDVALVGDVDRMLIDTGSGSVTLHVSDSLGASIVVDTGSGGVQTDIPIRVSSVSRDYLRGVIGDGKGTIKIDTGSGSVHLVK